MSWQISFQQVVQVAGRAAQSDVEASEQGIDGADVVEAHLVDELFENQGIVGEEVDAPLPIVETDRAGDNLFHFSGIAASDQAVFVHLALALLHGKRVPVLVFAAAAWRGRDAASSPLSGARWFPGSTFSIRLSVVRRRDRRAPCRSSATTHI